MIFYYQFLLIVFTIGGAAHNAATKAMVCLHAREQGKSRGGEGKREEKGGGEKGREEKRREENGKEEKRREEKRRKEKKKSVKFELQER